ncbi:MAG: 2-hydroxyglutaryl-CoA dehydratase [Clostridiaceae bacterium]
MKITVPNLGNTRYAAKALFNGLNIEYIMPPISNKETIAIGSLYSPEEICLPFKIMLGNYIQSIKNGADTIIITGSCGPCRYGEYCELQMNILKKLGYNLDFIVLDYPKSLGYEEFFSRLNAINKESKIDNIQKLKVLKTTKSIINSLDKLDDKAKFLSGYEKSRGISKILLNSCKNEIEKLNSPDKVLSTIKEYTKKLNNIELDKTKKPLKIAIIGEIYTIIEPFSNLFIEDKLMDYGVSSKRGLTPSWWVKNATLSPIKLNSLNLRYNSLKYLPYYIGGHARETIGEAVIAGNSDIDGIIQIFPMGCMPEIVSKSILPTISKDLNIPIMTLIVDEMTGETGYITRIEAFLDLLERRKENVLYGN